MARLPLPGPELTGFAGGTSPDAGALGARVPRDPSAAIPADVLALLDTLRAEGHAAYVVGGSLRDLLLGRQPADWDMATDADPARIVALFPGAVYENRFGTVAVRRGGETFEITTFRSDHDYADFRRPHRVEFGETIEADLARRDFTVNALAWGARPGDALGLVDPYDGRQDVQRRLLRAVGDPEARFGEDALRMVRAVRLGATLGFAIEPATLAAIETRAELVGHLSGERIAAELEKLLAAPLPSHGLVPLEATGLLRWISPELAEQRGIPQNKVAGEDLWDHTVRTVDAARADRPVVRLAALLHDIGKPGTFVDGRFHGHESAGARLADEFLRRLRFPRSTTERVVHLVSQHMFEYAPTWGDAAVRRFIAKTSRQALEELFELREADNVGSGIAIDANGLAELRARVAGQLAAEVVIERADLAVHGDDLMDELGLAQGPRLGAILDGLLDAVVEDPALNDRPTLLLLAQAKLAVEG
jgi:poly(A) polymerase/tRNA nucleotidyltransferase (CCA-adding enzyme)